MAASDRRGGDAFPPDEIRHELPASWADEFKRALVCAIRNPDTTPTELAAATELEANTVREALLELVRERNEDPADYRDTIKRWDSDGVRAYLRDFGCTLPDENIDNMATMTQHDTDTDTDTEADADAGDRRRQPASKDEHTDDEGRCRYCGAGPFERSDQVHGHLRHCEERDDTPTTGTVAAAHTDHEYVVLTSKATKDDLQYGTRYRATVNNVKGYGVFVTLSEGGPEDVYGLIHHSRLPALLQTDDFVEGDEVGVMLEDVTDDDKLAFELVATLDTVKNLGVESDDPEFAPAEPLEPSDDEAGGEPADADERDEEPAVAPSTDSTTGAEAEVVDATAETTTAEVSTTADGGDDDDTGVEPDPDRPVTETVRAVMQQVPWNDVITARELADEFGDAFEPYDLDDVANRASTILSKMEDKGELSRARRCDIPGYSGSGFVYYGLGEPSDDDARASRIEPVEPATGGVADGADGEVLDRIDDVADRVERVADSVIEVADGLDALDGRVDALRTDAEGVDEQVADAVDDLAERIDALETQRYDDTATDAHLARAIDDLRGFASEGFEVVEYERSLAAGEHGTTVEIELSVHRDDTQ